MAVAARLACVLALLCGLAACARPPAGGAHGAWAPRIEALTPSAPAAAPPSAARASPAARETAPPPPGALPPPSRLGSLQAGPAFAAPKAPATVPPPAPAPPRSASGGPLHFDAFVARVAADAAAGRDPDLAGHADLLAAVAADRAGAAEEARWTRQEGLERAARARHGRGTAWALLTAYFEPGGDADAMRRAYLDFDRVGSYTGKPGPRRLAAGADGVLAEVNGVRSVLGVRVGARWRFLARPLDRGPARIVATRRVEAPGDENMLESRVLVLLVPVEGGVRVAEVSSSVVATEVAAPLRALALQSAMGEVRARTRGLRAHWREYRAAPGAPEPR